MNCKPGDLAVVVGKDRTATLGAVVEVLRFRRICPECNGTEWSVMYQGREHGACDPYLRPIRDQDGNEPFVKTVSVDDQIDVLRRLNQRRKERA